MQNEVVYGDYYRVENAFNALYWYPASEFTPGEIQALHPAEMNEITIETGYFARFDDNDTWEGPFDSEEEANEYLEDIIYSQ